MVPRSFSSSVFAGGVFVFPARFESSLLGVVTRILFAVAANWERYDHTPGSREAPKALRAFGHPEHNCVGLWVTKKIIFIFFGLAAAAAKKNVLNRFTCTSLIK